MKSRACLKCFVRDCSFLEVFKMGKPTEYISFQTCHAVIHKVSKKEIFCIPEESRNCCCTKKQTHATAFFPLSLQPY